MANEWLLYGAVGAALVLGAVWLAWWYYYDRINRSLSAVGWVGWGSVRASGPLRRRLRARPELFIDRVADHPPTTPEEASAALHLLSDWAKHASDGFGDDSEADRAAWAVIQPLLRGPPGCVREEEYRVLRPRVEGWKVSHPGWAAAAEFALHRHGIHPPPGNLGRQCLLAWDDLTAVNRLHALEQVMATGESSPALLRTAARTWAGAPAPELGEGILRLAEQITPTQAQQLPDATVDVLVQLVQSRPGLTPVRLLAARHRAGRLLAADARGVNCTLPETAELLDSVRDHWDEFPDLATAAAVLDARRPEPRDPDLILAAHRARPNLHSPRRFLLSRNEGSADLRYCAASDLWRNGERSGEVAAALAFTGLCLGRDVPWAVLTCAVAVARMREVHLRQWFDRIKAAVVASPPAPDGLFEPALRLAELADAVTSETACGYFEACLRVFAASGSDARLRDDLAGVLKPMMTSQVPPRFVGVTGCAPLLAQLWVALFPWFRTPDSIPAWLPMESAIDACVAADGIIGAQAKAAFCFARELGETACASAARQAFSLGIRDSWLLVWLALWMRDHLGEPDAVDVCLATAELPGGAGDAAVVGLARLLKTHAIPVDPRYLIRAWRAGEKTETVLREFVERTSTTTDSPFDEGERELAAAAFQHGLPLPPPVQRRLVRSLWLEDEKQPLLELLLKRYVDDPALLAEFLECRPESADDHLTLWALAQLARARQTTAGQNRRLIAAMEADQYPPELAPFEGLAADDLLATERLGVIHVAWRLTGSGAQPLARFIPPLLEWLRSNDPPRYREYVSQSWLRELLVHRVVEAPDDTAALACVARAVVAGTSHTATEVGMVQRAFASNLLDSDGVVWLANALVDSEQPDQALPPLEWLATAQMRLREVGRLLAHIARYTGRPPDAPPWVSPELLARLVEANAGDVSLNQALAQRLTEVADPGRLVRLTLLLLARRVEVPMPVLPLALRVATTADERRTLADALLRSAPHKSSPTPDLCDALETTLAEGTLPDGDYRRLALGLLFDAGRLGASAVAEWLVLSHRRNQISLPQDLLHRWGEDLALLEVWPLGCADALRWYIKRGLLPGAPVVLLERLGLPSSPAPRPDDDLQYDRLRRCEERVRRGEAVPHEDLLELLEWRRGDPVALAPAARALCEGLLARHELARGTTLERLRELDHQRLLPAEGEGLFVASMVTTGRADLVAELCPSRGHHFGPQRLLDAGSADLVRTAFRLLHPRPTTRVMALDLLAAAGDKYPRDSFLSELLDALASGTTRQEFFDLLANQLQLCKPTDEQMRRGLTLLVPDTETARVSSSIRPLLLLAAEAGSLPRTEAVQAALVIHATQLEKYGHPNLLADARALRLALREVTSDPATRRRNDLILLKRHGHEFTAEEMVDLLRPDPDLPPGLADVAFDDENKKDVIAAALRLLLPHSRWSPAQIELAVRLICGAGEFESVFQRRPLNLDLLLNRLLQDTSAKQGIEWLARAVLLLPDHPDFGRWFDDLYRRLEEAQFDRRLEEAQFDLSGWVKRLLEAPQLPSEVTRRLLNFALHQLNCCTADPLSLLRAAERLGWVSRADAKVLIRLCLRGNCPDPAFALLERLVASSEESKLLESMPCIDLPFVLKTGEASLSLVALNDFIAAYLAESREERVLLRQLEVLLRLAHLDNAVGIACELWQRCEEGLGRAGGPVWVEWLDQRFRHRITGLAQTAEKISVSGSTERLAFAVATWLDLVLNPAPPGVPPPEQHVQRVLSAVRVFELPLPATPSELDQRLLARRLDVVDLATQLLREWVEGQPGCSWKDRVELVRLLARNAQDGLARERLEPLLIEFLPKGEQAGEAFVSIAKAAVEVLGESIRSSRFGRRRPALDLVDRIATATRRFYTPHLRSLMGEARTAYANLMLWSGLTWAFDHITRLERGRTRQQAAAATLWLDEVMREGQIADLGGQELLRAVRTALNTDNQDDLDEACRALERAETFAPLQSWRGITTSDETQADTPLLDGRYETIKVLSDERRARRGQVLRLRDRQTRQEVVGKLLPASSGEHLEQDRARMRREAELLSRLDHPGIVRILAHHLDALPYYIITEFIPGDDLEDWVSHAVRPSLDERLAVFADLLHAVRALHQCGCLHRNLHPRNVRVIQRGRRGSRAVLMDMASVAPQDTSQVGRTQLVQSAAAYMAPELKAGGKFFVATPAVDIFSLGRLLAFILTGRPDPHPDQLRRPLSGLADLVADAIHQQPRQRLGRDRGGTEAIDECIGRFHAITGFYRGGPSTGTPTPASGPAHDGTADHGVLSTLIRNPLRFRKRQNVQILRAQLIGPETEVVAVKVIPMDSDQAREVVPRLQNVATLREKLAGVPGIVPVPCDPVHDGEEKEIYLFSRFIAPGVSLEDVYSYAGYRGKPVCPALLFRWLRDCLVALVECHHREVFHRRLKPSNILIDKDGQVWVNDFILSKVYSERLLQKTQRLGRGDAYAAPELFGGSRARFDGADLYSLVLTFAVGIVVGHQPLTKLIAEQSVLERLIPALDAIGRRYGLTPLTQLIAEQLDREPAKRRHRTVAAFQQALEEVLVGGTWPDEDAVGLICEVACYAPAPGAVDEGRAK